MYVLYQSWKDSGKSKAEFAKENGLVPTTFYYWANKFRKKHAEGIPSGFNLLNITPAGGQGASARISYPSGITVELFGTPDRDLIRSLIQ